MNHLKPITILLVLLFLSKFCNAQPDPCGYDSIMQIYSQESTENAQQIFLHWQKLSEQRSNMQQETLPNSGSSTRRSGDPIPAQVVIPIVVNIVHAPSDHTPGMGSNITDAQVMNQIDVLNKHFSNDFNEASPAVNTGIQFCLATRKTSDGSSFNGIQRIPNNATTHSVTNTNFMHIGNMSQDEYLNIWVVTDIRKPDGNVGGILGYARPRGIYDVSGVVVRYRYFGDSTSCVGCNLDIDSEGKTLVHEVGHYLGLFHTHQGNCNGNSDTSCSISGDFCCDTPQEDGPTFSCTSTVNNCTDYPVDGDNMTSNFMGYAPDNCRTLFTEDQKNLMHATIAINNSSQIEASNLIATGAHGCNYLTALFSSSVTKHCDSGYITLYPLDTGRTFRWEVINAQSNATLLDSVTTVDSLVLYFNTPSRYHVKLTSIYGTDTVSHLRSNYLKIIACGVPLKSKDGNWFFGYYAGLKFTTGEAIAATEAVQSIPQTIYANEGCVSVSDSNGNLLFYGTGYAEDSFLIYNRDHEELHGTTQLIGEGSSYQGGVALLHPTNPNQYVLISVSSKTEEDTADGFGMRWSVLDMSLDNGKGGLIDTLVNIPVYPPRPRPFSYYNVEDSAFLSGEAIAAIPKCNGKDYWVITGEINSRQNINIFYFDSLGMHFDTTYSSNNNTRFGQFDFSRDGSWFFGGSALYKFDRSKGRLKLIKDFGKVNGNLQGVSFSANSKILYRSFAAPNTPIPIVQQIDLRYPLTTPETVISSFWVGGSLELGPDNRIYMANDRFDKLHVIEYSNNIVSSQSPNNCGIVLNAIPLKNQDGIGGGSSSALPNLINALPPDKVEIAIHYAISDCNKVELSTNDCCSENYKWYFGDGDSSSSKSPIHTYSGAGEYYVTVVTDRYTTTDTVLIDSVSVQIVGKTNICDTLNGEGYSVSPQNYELSYLWTASNGSILGDNKAANAEVKWSSNGAIEVVATNKPGCTDTANLMTTVLDFVENNTIEGNKNGFNSDTIFGSLPTGGSGIYTYQWQISDDSTNWTLLEGDTLKYYLPDGPYSNKKYFTREVISSTCRSFSNYIGVERCFSNNKIWYEDSACLVGQTFEIEGALPGFDVHAPNVSWEYGDGTHWFTVQSIFTDTTWDSTLLYSPLHIRRKLSNVNCSALPEYSNVLIQEARIRIKTQPSAIAVCKGTGGYSQLPLTIGLENVEELPVSYTWNVSFQKNVLHETTDSFAAEISDGGCTGCPGFSSINCTVATPCGSLQSQSTMLYRNNSYDSMSITKHPQDVFSTNDSAVLSADFYHVQFAQMFWELSKDGGTTWDLILGEHDTTILLTGFSGCDTIWQVRAYAHDGCKRRTSEVAHLYPLGYDLWMKDLWSDIGEEPFIEAEHNYTHSPDLWIRYNEFDQTKHSNPWGPQSAYYQFPNYDTTNWINVTIRNNGPEESEQAELYLYWTRASTGEKWDEKWLDVPGNRFNNQDSGKHFPQGGRINHMPVIIPAIPAGDTINVNYLWDPIDVPKPGWYYHYVNGIKRYVDFIGVCFLARIETCETSPFGITYPEKPQLQPNVYKNNNIITHNAVMSELYPTSSLDEEKAIWIPVRNVWDTVYLVDIGLDFNEAEYFDYGEIIVILDDSLESKWIQAGQMGTGFTIINSYTLLIDNPSVFTLNGLEFQSGEEVNIGFYYREKLGGLAPTGMTKLYWFEAWQQTQGNNSRDGAVSIFVDAPTSSATGGGGEGGEGGPPTLRMIKEKKQESKGVNEAEVSPIVPEEKDESRSDSSLINSEFKAYPNPFENILKVSYTLSKDVEVEVCLTDVLGRCILDIVSKQKQAKGRYHKTVNTENITPGMYYLELKSEGKVFAKKLIRIN